MSHRRLSCLLLAAAFMLTAAPGFAALLRVDINSQARSDMRAPGWTAWNPGSGGELSHKFGDLTVTLRPAEGGSIELFGSKSHVVKGLRLGADGATIERGGSAAVLEVEIEGLTPGRHTFVGYHHAEGGANLGSYTVTCDSAIGEAVPVKPTDSADHDDVLGSSCIEFEAAAGRPVVIRYEAGDGPWNGIVINGFEIDGIDPTRRALRPLPMDLERHADGDDGTVELEWKPAASASGQDLYLVHADSPEAAADKLAAATKGSDGHMGSVEGGVFSAPIVANNAMLHYAWRVDTTDAEGNVTPGAPWRFRVRHLAFPTAEGYGRFAIGGRGGRVIHVTNLNDSGPGSLRAAVEATGPRTVVFDVSGLITLESRLLFNSEREYLTVAGQTAPGKGICLRGYTFGGLGARDTIIRFVRLRLGNLNGTMDGMGFASSDHCIIDHCSISWTIDEAFSSRGAKNITFQRNLISEALNVAGHDHYGDGSSHGFAGSIGGDVGSFHHSLLAHNAGRNWSLAGALDQANRHAGRLDIRNMVVYNWGHRTTDGGAREVNFVNNYYKPGPATSVMTYLNPQFENPAFGPQQYYVAGNIMEDIAGPEGPEGPFEGMRPRGRQDAPVTVPEPFFEPHVTTHSAEEAYENVLADVGCNVPMLDDHDKRIIREVREGTFTYRGSVSDMPGLPDSQEDVGGWEEYPEIHRAEDWDVDGDGMPGKWEAEKGLNPSDASDGPVDPDGDGYTNLEDYLNWLAAGNSLS